MQSSNDSSWRRRFSLAATILSVGIVLCLISWVCEHINKVFAKRRAIEQIQVHGGAVYLHHEVGIYYGYANRRPRTVINLIREVVRDPFSCEPVIVSFSHCRINSAALRAVSQLNSLETLSLNQCPIADAELSRLQDLTELRHLDLAGTGITDAGVVYLFELKSLQSLNLCDTKVTEDGINEVRRVLPQVQVYR